MRLNLRVVRALQFLSQFKLDIWHKSGKEHIILNTLSRLAGINVSCINFSYSKLDILFNYNTTLIKIHPSLILKILADYKDDKYWAHLHCQVPANKNLDDHKILLPFVSNDSYRYNSNPYMSPSPQDPPNPLPKLMSPYPQGPTGPSPKPSKATLYPRSSPIVLEDSRLPSSNKTKLLYYINKTTDNL